jgi:large repetitive protein
VSASALTLSCSLPAAQVGTSFSGSCTPTGGTGPYAYTISAGSIATGLTLNADGTVTGTPTTAGTYNFTIQVTDSSTSPQTATQNFANFVVGAAALTLNCSGLPGGAQVGAAYTGSCSAAGGTAPYTYSVSSGSLPGGLSLNASSGAVTGIPVAAGASPFTITVTDSSSTPLTAAQAATITVAAAAPALTVSCNLPTTLPAGQAYSGSCSASGGTAPYTFAVNPGSLPAGLTLNATSGAITGTPTTAGGSSFSIVATDSAAQTGSQAYTVTVQMTVTCALPMSAQVGVAYSGSCSAAGERLTISSRSAAERYRVA